MAVAGWSSCCLMGTHPSSMAAFAAAVVCEHWQVCCCWQVQLALSDLEHGEMRDLHLELQPPAEHNSVRNPLEAGFKVGPPCCPAARQQGAGPLAALAPCLSLAFLQLVQASIYCSLRYAAWARTLPPPAVLQQARPAAVTLLRGWCGAGRKAGAERAGAADRQQGTQALQPAPGADVLQGVPPGCRETVWLPSSM